MGFEIVNLVLNAFLPDTVTRGARGIKFTEQTTQFTRIGLAQVSVDFLDQFRHGGFLVHGLVGQRTKLGTQCGNHPS